MKQSITNENLEKKIEYERYSALHTIENWLEIPILILGFIWLIILVVEFIWTPGPTLEAIAIIIWIIFVVDFCIRFFLAPRKLKYVRKNWLTAISLVVPALRIFRIARVLQILRISRTVRGFQLLRLFGSLNRGIKALRASLGRRGFVYVVILTIIVTMVGAAGMYTFERYSPAGGFTSYGDSLWWTAMVMTTVGANSWPETFEGRILSFFLSLYAFAVFGYITAVLATYFIDRDANDEKAEIASEKSIKEIKEEIRMLRQDFNQRYK